MSVAIVGAGPAGAMAAIRLARAGEAVTLFDPSHPREKPCGGGVTRRALRLIADAVDVSALPALSIDAAVVEEPATDRAKPATPRPGVCVPLKHDADALPLLVVTSRAIFDKALVEAAIAAGAQLVTERVVDVLRAGASMTVRTRGGHHTADVVLGADGANSLVRKKLAAPFLRSEISIAAGFFVRSPRGVAAPAIAIQSMIRQPGYLWSFPRPDHLAVGVCAPAATGCSSTELRRESLDWIHGHGLDKDATLEPYAWPIPSAGFSRRDELRAAGPGWMLLGDAAGLVDPLTREGIYYALLSGIWAAEAITGRSAGGPEATYAARLRNDMYPELRRAARLSGIFFSPQFSELFVSALRRSGPVRRIFADLAAGTQPYKGLRWRLLSTREWRLAVQAMRLVVQ